MPLFHNTHFLRVSVKENETALQGIFTLLAPISSFSLGMSLGILMKMSLPQVLDTPSHLFADKEPLSSDWISVSWKHNFYRLAGEDFNCLWTGREKDVDRTGPGVWRPSLKSENWPVGWLWAVCLALCALRPSSSVMQTASDSRWGIIQTMHFLIHPATHSSLWCLRAKPAVLSTAGKASKWKPMLLKPGLSNQNKHDLPSSAFPICQSGTLILTSFIRYFDIYWRTFFPSIRNLSHAEKITLVLFLGWEQIKCRVFQKDRPSSKPLLPWNWVLYSQEEKNNLRISKNLQS